MAVVISDSAVVAVVWLVKRVPVRLWPAPPPVAVPTLPAVRAPTVAAIVVVPAVVPSLTVKFVAVAVKTPVLLKFVDVPMLPISVRMLWYSVSAAPD
jgi:hypothetical protein